MLQGGAPCVVDAYMDYLKCFLSEQRMADVFLFNPREENDYLGFDPNTLAQHISSAIVLADIMVEIDHVLHVIGQPGALDQLQKEWQRFANVSRALDEFHAELPAFIDRLAQLPRTRDPLTCPRVVVVGDFFTRFSPFFMDGVRALYAERGIILKPVDLNELSLYIAYDALAGTASHWGMAPGGLALAKACTSIFRAEGKQYVQQWLSYQKLQRLRSTTGAFFTRPAYLWPAPTP
jgi:predicted nucleotide-binding protein (sugar kinase/HSP70/actin superfamily)